MPADSAEQARTRICQRWNESQTRQRSPRRPPPAPVCVCCATDMTDRRTSFLQVLGQGWHDRRVVLLPVGIEVVGHHKPASPPAAGERERHSPGTDPQQPAARAVRAHAGRRRPGMKAHQTLGFVVAAAACDTAASHAHTAALRANVQAICVVRPPSTRGRGGCRSAELQTAAAMVELAGAYE